VNSLDEKLQPLSFSKGENSSVDSKKEERVEETLEQAIETEKNTLLSIQGLKEVALLTDSDRRKIFETEQEKNH